MLVALEVDAQDDDATGFGEVDAVDHQRDESEPGQVGGEQLTEGGFGHRDKLARDRRLAYRRGCFINLPADRLEPDRVAAGREPGEHLLHRHLAQDLGRVEQLVRRDRQFVRPPRPRPAPAGGSPLSPGGRRSVRHSYVDVSC
jgi:hypothetical protein